MKTSTLNTAAIGLGAAGVGLLALGYREAHRPDKDPNEACELCHGYVNLGVQALLVGAIVYAYGALR